MADVNKNIIDAYRSMYESKEEVLDETNKNDKSDDGDGLDAVQPKAVKKKFDDRKDKDIDNDGDVDSSDKYLKNRRKAISKAMGKEKVEINPTMKEETKVDSKLENPHNCATHVYSESWGDGRTVPTMHADPDDNGNVAWYDVMFDHGIEKGVPIEELKVIKSSHHGHKKRGSK